MKFNVFCRLLVISSIIITTGCMPKEEITYQGGEEMADITGKKVLFIIASNNFRDEEFQQPKQIIEAKGGEVIVACSSLSASRGMLGAVVKPDILITDTNVGDYDAIIFIGGSGSSEYWDNPVAHKLAREAVAAGKVLGAICIAPVTLANAGVLKGKKATVFSSEVAKLRNMGAICSDASVEIDGKIVTANGPQAASMFGEAIVKLLME
jgi:protease I